MKKFFLKSKRFWFAIAPLGVRLGAHWLVKKGLLAEHEIPDAVDGLLTGLQGLGIYYIIKGGPQLTAKPAAPPTESA